MQLFFQSSHLFPPLNELLHDVHIVFFSQLKPFTIVQNEPFVLLRDKLSVDVRFAWLIIRRKLDT